MDFGIEHLDVVAESLRLPDDSANSSSLGTGHPRFIPHSSFLILHYIEQGMLIIFKLVE